MQRFLSIARHNLESAEQNEPGRGHEALIALTFSALAVEALINAIGERVVTDWEIFESANPNAKVRIIAERLGVVYDYRIEPWATIRGLISLRNKIVHAKPEAIVVSSEISEEQTKQRAEVPPDSKLERDITVENARRAFDAVMEVKELLCGKIPMELQDGLLFDEWSSTTVLKSWKKYV